MHGLLGREVKNLLGVEVKITLGSPFANSDPDWPKVKPGTAVRWMLVGASSERAESGGRGDLVVPLFVSESMQTGSGWWVAWVEEWYKREGKDFAFSSAGWRAFLGPAGFQRAKQLVLRAEWGPLESSGNPEHLAHNGQPHWHTEMVVPTAMADFLTEEVGGTEGDVIRIIDADAEVPTDTVPPGLAMDRAKVNLNRIHLGMAGWQNKPHAWQMAVGLDFAKSLRTWSVATLTYLREQLSRYAAT